MKIGADYNGNAFTKEQAFERFITKKKSLNLARKTIIGYATGWTTFLQFEKYRKKTFSLDEINEDLLAEYRLYLIEQTHANEVTRATYVKNLRTILRDFMTDGLISEFQVVIPKYSTPVQETYTVDELHRLLKKPSMKKGEFNFAYYRTWVMISYIIDTTNRADTVLGLKIKDLDFDGNKITLRRVKSKKPYQTPMSVALVSLIFIFRISFMILKTQKYRASDYS